MEARERERLCAMTFAASAAGAQAELGGKGARGSCHPQSAAIGRRGREEEEEVRFLFSLLPPLHAPSFLLFSFASPLPVLVRYCCVPFLPVSCPSSDWPMATPTHPLPPPLLLSSLLVSSMYWCLSLFFFWYIFFLPDMVSSTSVVVTRPASSARRLSSVTESLFWLLSLSLSCDTYSALYIYIYVYEYIYIYIMSVGV